MTTLIELVFMLLLTFFFVTQIILPLMGYGRYFWIFRKTERRKAQIQSEIEEIREKEELVDLEKRRNKMHKERRTKS